jgi:hypothetical protein
MMRLLPGVFLLSAVMSRESEVMRRFATGMNGDEDLGQDIIMQGQPFWFAEGKKSGEKGSKLVSKKTLKRQLRKMVKKAAKVEKKLKALKKMCKQRRRAHHFAPMASQFIGPQVGVVGPIAYPNLPFAMAEGMSYEEAEANIKGMFNKKSKDYLYQQLDSIDLDIQEMKRKYKKLAKKCGY